jgi:hypothetical protein
VFFVLFLVVAQWGPARPLTQNAALPGGGGAPGVNPPNPPPSGYATASQSVLTQTQTVQYSPLHITLYGIAYCC